MRTGPVSASAPSRHLGVLTVLCGLALVLVTGCSAAAGSPGPAATAPSSAASGATTSSGTGAPEETVIHVQDFGYQVPDSVAPGATVSVMNMDGEAHTVTADEGDAFDAQVTGGATGSFTAPLEPGTYPFHCTYHSNMQGVLVVR